MDMRQSRVLRALRGGKVATCVKTNLNDRRNIEIAAMCGFDCIWIDMEHVPNSIDEVEQAVMAAKIYDCDILTRVSRGGYSDYIRPLEADSAGIMVPHVMSVKDAEYVQYYTKFYPVGRRPLDGGNADGRYCMVDNREYMKQSNDQRFVVVQIEDPEPMEELDGICSLPGIDMVFFGPADFSQGAGIPCEWSNPLLEKTRRQIAAAARRHGKFAGTVGDIGNHDALIEMGYHFISVGADVLGLSAYYRNISEKCSGKDAAAL